MSSSGPTSQGGISGFGMIAFTVEVGRGDSSPVVWETMHKFLSLLSNAIVHCPISPALLWYIMAATA